ncbi:hypothetical protein [Fischerella sp. PCC 9605]|uniref:hypothetical protein n=1 Tax=Fischerella sp. PCC 9605 TaxID=1173024 RepID=UPI00047CF50C|nr:hypothetical protein [Fischerella sp. PCC 9605]
MKSFKFSLIVLGSTGLLFLGACSNSNQAANTENNPATSTSNNESPSTLASPAAKTNNEHGASKGGQVVETGKYHLEFVPEKEANGTHLDLYLQTGDRHEAVPNAKVTAQVQQPDGTQKTIPFSYDATGKHYAAFFPGNAAGQYQVKVTASIGNQKVDGRFSFNK